jgi:hypothetical protein
MSCFLFVNTIYFCLTTSRLYQLWVDCGIAGGANFTSDIDNNSALTWHKIDIRMRLRIGENASVSRAFSPIRAEYVYQILLFLSCPSVRHTVFQRNSSATTEQNFMKLGR